MRHHPACDDRASLRAERVLDAVRPHRRSCRGNTARLSSGPARMSGHGEPYRPRRTGDAAAGRGALRPRARRHRTDDRENPVHIVVINPNTTASMTGLIGESARAVAAAGTVVTAVNPDMGPASIESHYDEALSVPGLLAEIARAQAGEPRPTVRDRLLRRPRPRRRARARRRAGGGDRGGGHARRELPGPRVLGGHDAGPDGRAGLGPRRALRDDPVLPQRARLRDPRAGPRGPGVRRVRGDRRGVAARGRRRRRGGDRAGLRGHGRPRRTHDRRPSACP